MVAAGRNCCDRLVIQIQSHWAGHGLGNLGQAQLPVRIASAHVDCPCAIQKEGVFLAAGNLENVRRRGEAKETSVALRIKD